MRLSLILLVVAAAFVAVLDSTAASDASIVHAATLTNVHESIGNNRRFLRARKEDNDPVYDEEEEEEEEEERGLEALADKARAALVMARLVGKSGDDLLEAITNLGKSEVNALFSQGKSHVANIIPGFHSGMGLDDFVAAMKSAELSDEVQDVLVLGYTKYLAHNM